MNESKRGLGRIGLPPIVGLVLGVASAVLLDRQPWGQPLVFLPMLGALIGYAVELHRRNAAGHQVASKLRMRLAEETETRLEIMAIGERQNRWAQLVEESLEERARMLDEVVRTRPSSRDTTLGGFSHDLRNLLFVVKGNARLLRGRLSAPADAAALVDLEAASQQLQDGLARLLEVVHSDLPLATHRPTVIDVSGLVDVLHRRLRALVHGRDIEAKVFATREAPEHIELDPLVFDRVVDSLLTHAAKQTKRGSIVLEIGGTPDLENESELLTLKLSDTGPGIEEGALEEVRRPLALEATTRRSYGVGLSSASRLLAQIGGRLDVLSRPGRGTTFWAHVPIRPPSRSNAPTTLHDDVEAELGNVVTIRRAEGA